MNPIHEEQLSSFLEQRMAEWTDVSVSNLNRLPIGASRETYRLDVSYLDAEGRRSNEHLILRRDPPASHVESERRHEFMSYQAVYGHGIPVPKMLLLEEDPTVLGGAVSIAEDIRGYHNSEYVLQEPQWKERLPHIGEQMWGLMGRLAALDINQLDLAFMKPTTPADTAMQELNYWIDVYERHRVEPDPITEAAIRYLRRHPPPPAAKLCLVHGDFRAGNFLYNDDGDIRAILDWEMAHMGDPLEDLAWSMTRVFSFGKDERRSGLLEKSQAIAIWESASGIRVDPQAMNWWELFASIKGQALWNSTAHVWAAGQNREVVMAYASWWLMNSQNKAMLELMGQL